MEYNIAKLLQEFEQGRMNRRQLIQSLALMITTATTVRAASTVTSDAKGLKAIAVNHISYQVADYGKTRDFYADLFGMRVSHDDGNQCYLAFGDAFIIPRNRPSNTPRIDHIAYTIDKWDNKAVEAELKRRGLRPQPDTENSFHVEDPNGFDLQISGREMKP
jgi:catechol 2,3-dioxygenase-like lactoylglutathione lyase family enzyme